MDAKKNALRAEDIQKGVFVPVSSLPKKEPKKADTSHDEVSAYCTKSTYTTVNGGCQKHKNGLRQQANAKSLLTSNLVFFAEQQMEIRKAARK
jgi:hypothetical protein